MNLINRFEHKIFLSAILIFIVSCILACDSKTDKSQDALSSSGQLYYNSISGVNYISPQMLKNLMDSKASFVLVDLRTQKEYLSGHIPGAISIPYSQLSYRVRELNPKVPIVLYCNLGLTSINAAKYLLRLGFTKTYSLSGGYAKWEYAIELSNGRLMI